MEIIKAMTMDGMAQGDCAERELSNSPLPAYGLPSDVCLNPRPMALLPPAVAGGAAGAEAGHPEHSEAGGGASPCPPPPTSGRTCVKVAARLIQERRALPDRCFQLPSHCSCLEASAGK